MSAPVVLADNCSLSLSVLVYPEEGQYCALCLEMDLRGYGDTEDEAFKDLGQAVAMQLSFAHFKNCPEMAFRDAEPQYFMMYAKLREAELKRMAAGLKDLRTDDYVALGLPMPDAHIIKRLSKTFGRSGGQKNVQVPRAHRKACGV